MLRNTYDFTNIVELYLASIIANTTSLHNHDRLENEDYELKGAMKKSAVIATSRLH